MQATLTIQDNGHGGLDVAFGHAFDTRDVVTMACVFSKLKATLSQQAAEYSRLLTEDELEEFREAELLAMRLFGSKRKLDPTLALWEDGR